MKTARLSSLVCAFATAVTVFSDSAGATPGDLDLGFGDSGTVVTDFGPGTGKAFGVAVQGDGMIVVAGSAYRSQNNGDFVLARLRKDGTPDMGFGIDGKVMTPIGSGSDGARCVAIQPDGRIVAAGYAIDGSGPATFAVVRYNPDGTLDTDFGNGGKVTTDIAREEQVLAIAVQSDGKIVAAGYAETTVTTLFALVRYNTDGTMDAGFGTGGKVTSAIGVGHSFAYGVSLQSDGKIVTAGRTTSGPARGFALARYNADGTLDADFGNEGTITSDFATEPGGWGGGGVAVQGDGKIVAGGGHFDGSRVVFALARFDSDGAPDAGFGTGGTVRTDFRDDATGYSLVIQGDGKIVMTGAGVDSELVMARYETDGTLDLGFGDGGRVRTAASITGYAVAIQRYGRIVVAGTQNMANQEVTVMRYLGEPDTDGDGIPDQYETGTGVYASP